MKDKIDYHELASDILEYSYEHKLGYLPSALSQAQYLHVLLPKLLDFEWFAGKQFGAQAFYCIYNKMTQEQRDIKELNDPALLTDNVPPLLCSSNYEFRYVEKTLGNALGNAIGYAMTTDKPVWVNLPDSVFQMGATLEAIQMISRLNIRNLFITIDANGVQRASYNTTSMEHIEKLFEAARIPVAIVNPFYNWDYLDRYFNDIINFAKDPAQTSQVLIFSTTKGYPFTNLMNFPVKNHYVIMNEEEYQVTKDSKCVSF